MRKLTVPIVLVALIFWLVVAEPPKKNEGDLNALWFYSRVTAQEESCCLYGDETNPHQVCVDNVCQWVEGCGLNDCSLCLDGNGCDPNAEANCLNNNGYWDPASCTCTQGCDPDGSAEQSCYYSGGSWDAYNCTCEYQGCNPGPPELDSYVCSGSYGCECDWSCELVYCESCSYNYVQYCQDGSVFASWTEDSGMYCYDTGFWCGCCS
jgi:hypothetical protein